MTFGDKLSKLRKESNYTQEQLAEMLDVSRQSISKWESDLAYPETDKLIRLSELFHCSVDFLLKDDMETNGQTPSDGGDAAIGMGFRRSFRERKSEKTLWGMPLWHVGRNARGVVAVGIRARGIIAIGLKARGVISVGLLSLGLLSFGMLSLGLLAFGLFALGIKVFWSSKNLFFKKGSWRGLGRSPNTQSVRGRGFAPNPSKGAF